MINQLLSHIDYKSLFNALGEGVVYILGDGTVGFLNDEAQNIFRNFPGFCVGAQVKSQTWKIFSKTGEPVLSEAFGPVSVLHTGFPVRNSIVKLVNENSQFIWIDFNADPVQRNTEWSGVIMTVVELNDLMEEKQRLRAIATRATETDFNLELILQNTVDAFLITDKTLKVISFNEAYRKMIFGLWGREIKKEQNLLDLVPPSEQEYIGSIMNNVLAGQTYDEQQVAQETDGEKIYNTVVTPLMSGGSIIGTFLHRRDVTERFRMQERLRISNERFELAAKSSYDLIWEIDLVNDMVHFNDVMQKVFLHEVKSPISREWFMKLILFRNDENIIQGKIDDFLSSGLDRTELPVHRSKRGDGSIAYVQVNAIKVFDKHHKITKVIGVTRDVSEKHLYERKLQESNDRFLLVQKATKDGLYEYNAETDKYFFNDALFETFGFLPSEIVSQDDFFLKLIHPDDRMEIRRLSAEFSSGKAGIFSYPDFRMLHKNGTVIYVELKCIAVRGKNTRIVKSYGNIKNITDRFLMQEQLRLSNERLELASKASFDIVWDTDLVQKTIFFNEALEINLGIKGNISVSTDFFYQQMVHPADVEKMRKAFVKFIRCTENYAVLPEHRLLKANGDYTLVEAKMYGMRNDAGRITRIIGVSSDISVQRVHELELQELNHELAAQAAELKKSNQDLERFAYVASHDLQEPLRMVSSFLSLIKKKYNQQLDDTGRKYIHFAVDGADRMKKLILDLLEFSKIGGTPVEQEDVHVGRLCNDLVNEFVFSIKEKNAIVTCHDLPEIKANRGQLTHVFRNLLSNALKYSPHTPLVEIGCHTKEHWQFYVKDNGIGIDPRYFEKIFIIFQQLHTQAEYNGTGMGLAIAKKIVEQQGGRMWVESNVGAGSTFYFTHPKFPNKV